MNLSWEIAFGLGAAALFCALAYGMWSSHTRNRANDALTEKATHELHAHPDTYPETRAELEKEVRPS
jgi:hypothetical protein